MSDRRTLARVRALLQAGGHLLAVSIRDKAAVRKAWQRSENRLKEGQTETRVNRHGWKAVGIIPRSIGCVVIDVDDGGDEAKDWLLETFPGAHAHPSSCKGRWHVWVWTDCPEIGNYSWESGYGAGQFRHGHGYVVLWSPGTVVRWLTERTVKAPIEDVQAFVRHHKASLVPARPTDGAPLDLDQIEAADWSEGNRNNTLNALAFIAAAHGEGVEELRDYALAKGLTPEEVDKTLGSAISAGNAVVADILGDLPTLKPGPEKDRPKFCILKAKDPPNFRKALEFLKVGMRWNERALAIEFRRDGGPWFAPDDMTVATLRWDIQQKCRQPQKKGPPMPVLFSQDAFRDLMNTVLDKRRTDPFRNWLENLPAWDGEARIDGMFHGLYGCADTPLTRWASRFVTMGAVRRAFLPGCKLDEMPVLIGRQGFGKTALLREIVDPDHPEWYVANLNLAAAQKDRVEALQKRVIVEVSDMAGADRADLKSLNAFLTTTDDGSVRLAYRRNTETLHRRCIMVGTADDPNCLPNDPAGLRRFVPVLLQHGSDIEAYMAEHREQLWAEALHRFREGEEARLPRELHGDQRAAAETHRRKAEVLEEGIQGLEIRQGTLAEIAFEVGLAPTIPDARRLSPRDSARLVNALRVCGWKRFRTMTERGWKRADEPDDILG